MPSPDTSNADAAKKGVFVREDDGCLSLYFDFTAVQSRMRRGEPEELVLGYTRTMMGFLLLTTDPRRIAMIGLGGGSMPKYCHATLPDAAIVVVEIDPEVIALRDQFLIPQDNERFEVLEMDGADFVRHSRKKFDVLVVDGFDIDGQPAQLCTQEFYDDCHEHLAADGTLAVNLHNNAVYDLAVQRLRNTFGDDLIIVDCESSANKIAFGFKGDLAEILDRHLSARLRKLHRQHPVNLSRTALCLRREWLNADAASWLNRQLASWPEARKA